MSEQAAKNTTSRRGAALASTLHHHFFIFQAFSSGLIYEERHVNSSAIVSGCRRSKGNIQNAGSHQLQPTALLTRLPKGGHPPSHSDLQMVPCLVIDLTFCGLNRCEDSRKHYCHPNTGSHVRWDDVPEMREITLKTV